MADAQNNLAKIRRRLQADISAFQEGTAYYIDSLELVLHDDQDDSDMTEGDKDASDMEDDFSLWDDDSESAEDSADSAEVDACHPEDVSLALPSSFGVAACNAAGISAQVDQEMDLRIGQANDALHQLRVLLGHKVYLYRTSIRHNKSQKGKTRAFSSLGRVQMSVRDEHRVYAHARRAMIKLGASSDLLARYQLLTSKDLKITTAAYDPSVHAQRSSKLAWFWKMDGARAVNESSWMKECRWS